MNQLQRTYIKRRVEGILAEKIAESREKFTIKSKMLSNQERIRLVRTNKVRMKTEKELLSCGNYGSLYINSIFDFSKFEVKGGLNQVEHSKHTKKLKAKANEICDTVMIGDAEEALKMIKDFESFKG